MIHKFKKNRNRSYKCIKNTNKKPNITYHSGKALNGGRNIYTVGVDLFVVWSNKIRLFYLVLVSNSIFVTFIENGMEIKRVMST